MAASPFPAKPKAPAAFPAPGLRARRAAERRTAIIEAALELFSSRGFAATRIEDVARRAGVAKGTVYLNFADKEALFEAIVRAVVLPIISQLKAADFSAIGCVRQAIETFGLPAAMEMATSRRGDVARLLLAEGPRFPRLADFYHREVVAPGLAQIRRLMLRAVETGEIAPGRLTDFPQLLAAPVLMIVLWQTLFQRLEPLDADAMLRTHLDLVFGDGCSQTN